MKLKKNADIVIRLF